MKIITALMLTLCCVLVSFAQAPAEKDKSVVMVVNQNAIDENRYEGIEKTPYLFQEFAKAKAYNKGKNETEEYVINYNGNSKEFEFIFNDIKSEMDAAYYDVIEVENSIPSKHYKDKYTSGKVTFVKGIDPSDPRRLDMLVYSDETIVIFKKFSAKKFKRTMSSGEKVEAFVPKFDYFMIKDGKKSLFRMSKKNILATLDNAEVEKFAKKNKLKLDSESDLKEVLAYYNKVTLGDKPSSDAVAANKN